MSPLEVRFRTAGRTRSMNVLVKAILAQAFAKLDGHHLTGLLERLASRSTLRWRLSYMMASRSSCTIRPATLIWPPNVG